MLLSLYLLIWLFQTPWVDCVPSVIQKVYNDYGMVDINMCYHSMHALFIHPCIYLLLVIVGWTNGRYQQEIRTQKEGKSKTICPSSLSPACGGISSSNCISSSQRRWPNGVGQSCAICEKTVWCNLIVFSITKVWYEMVIYFLEWWHALIICS